MFGTVGKTLGIQQYRFKHKSKAHSSRKSKNQPQNVEI